MSRRVWVEIVERWRSSRGWLEAGEAYALPHDEAMEAVEADVAEWRDGPPGEDDEDASG